ncbi:MAG TPA: TerC family protein [Acidimicrobiales bacterium]
MTLLASAGDAGSFVDIDVPGWAWLALLAFLGVLLAIDILLVHRSAHVVPLKEAAIESSVWIAIGLGFAAVVAIAWGGAASGEYLAAYLVEKSLSVDNVFVWAVIFSYFAVPRQYQHRVLFWGIYGALALRAVFIFAGVALLDRFEWLLFVFGAFLIFTAVRLVMRGDEETDPGQSRFVRWVRRVVPSTPELHGHHLFTKVNGRRIATPLLIVLLVVEASDVVFAVDSVPAVLAVSRETFIVFSSNAFAILGLRALYFLLADLHARFDYLEEGLAVILAFVGLKMIVSRWYHIPTWFSLTFIALTLALAIFASLRKGEAQELPSLEPADHAPEQPPPVDER